MIEGTPPIDRHAAAAAVERNFVETWQLIAAAYPDGEIHDADGLTWHAFTGPNEDPRSTSVLRINLADGEADAAIDGLLAELRGRRPGLGVVDVARNPSGGCGQAAAGARPGAVARLARHGDRAGRPATATGPR